MKGCERMKDEHIAPCPFCGRADCLEVTPYDVAENTRLICGAAALSIYCTRCDAQRTYYARIGEDYAAARRNALAAWNERMNYD